MGFNPKKGLKARTEKGRIAALLLATFAAAACAGLLITSSHASGPQAIGINLNPNSDIASGSSAAETCTEVKAGDEFAADVYVTNIDSLTAWELRVDFDPAIISLESADYNYMLVKSGGSVFPSEFEQEKPGRMFLAAAEPHSPDGGSGVLAELHLKALANGVSALGIATDPYYFGPQITGATGVPVGDNNGDRIWDGAVDGATVYVGKPCAPATPAPATASPGPGHSTAGSTPVTSLAPGETIQPSPGATSTGGDTSSSATGVPLVIQPGTEASPPTNGSQESISTPKPNDSNADAAQQPPITGDKPAPHASDSGGGSDNTLWLIIAGLVAAGAITMGSALLFLRRTSHE